MIPSKFISILITCLLTHVLLPPPAFAQPAARIAGTITGLAADTVQVIVTMNSITRKSHTLYLPAPNGTFDTTFVLAGPAHISISAGGPYLRGIIEPGDRLQLSGDAGAPASWLAHDPRFALSQELWQFFNNLSGNKSAGLKSLVAGARSSATPFDRLFAYADSAEACLAGALEEARPRLSQAAYRMLQADIRGRFLLFRYNIPTYVYSESHEQTLATRTGMLTPRSARLINERLQFDAALHGSDTYCENVYTILFKEYSSRTMGQSTNRLADKYRFLDSLLAPQLRGPVLTLFLESDLAKLNQGEDLEQLISRTYAANPNSEYAAYINGRVTQLFKKGAPAPPFRLEDAAGKPVTLAHFRGKVVFVDFWFRACVPCLALFEKLRPVKERFAGNRDVVFLTVSVDSRPVWLKALADLKLAGYHAYTQGLGNKHQIIADYKVVAYPTTTLIGRNGQVVQATPSDVPGELISQIEEALRW